MNPYRSLLLLLLPVVGCTGGAPKDTADSADTADSGDSGDSGDTDTIAPISEEGCYLLDAPATECPDPATVPTDDILPATCGAEVLSVDGPGTLGSCPYIGGMAPIEACMYPITVLPPPDPCDYGRPLVLAGSPRLAGLARGTGWVAGPAAPAGSDAARAAIWARIALAEHASVASFSKLALDLVSVGAPAELVAEAHAAALDEIRHAKLAFGLASRHAGEPLGPRPLPMRELRIDGDLAALAAATAREGCVAETLSALQVAEAHDRATDPAEKAALAVIARDEGKHALLAWKVVRWAIDTGGEPVRVAVAVAFGEAPAVPVGAAGLLPADIARTVIDRGWREVVVPTADALLDDRLDPCTA